MESAMPILYLRLNGNGLGKECWISMDKENKKIYTTRISQANRSELVVIIYELMLESLAEAGQAFEKEDFDTADVELKRVQGFLCELRGSLDFQFPVSYRLASLYRYVNEQLVKSITRKKDVGLASCERVLQGVKESFEEIAKQDTSGPVMENSQQVYAGLTYGKGSLNEVAIDPGTLGRGFQV